MGSWAFSFGPFADDPISFERIVERLAVAGFDGIEICGFPPQVTLDKYPNSRSRAELARYLSDRGLGISGYAADFTRVNPVTAGKQEAYLDLFRRNLELCAEIGSPSIRVDSVAAPGSIEEHDYVAAFHRLADVWRQSAALAWQAGVRVVWEFEPGFAFNKPSEILAMHRLVDHPNFQILLDTAHAHMCAVEGVRQHGPREILPGGVAGFLRKLQGSIGALHLVDSDGTLHGDETSTHRPLAQGLLDFQALAPQLLEISQVEWWCIDLSFWAGSWALIEPSRDYVRSLMGALVTA